MNARNTVGRSETIEKITYRNIKNNRSLQQELGSKALFPSFDSGERRGREAEASAEFLQADTQFETAKAQMTPDEFVNVVNGPDLRFRKWNLKCLVKA